MSETNSSGDHAPGQITRGIAEYLQTLEPEQLPREVAELEKLHVLDTLGCILYGTTTPWVGKLSSSLAALEGTSRGTTIGANPSLPAGRSVLVNGTASHSMDFDDHCQHAGIHAGSATVPSALGFCRDVDRKVSGSEFLAAVTAGCEIGIRSGFGIGFGCAERGHHIAGFTGTFAAVATTGKLLDLDIVEMQNAIGIAGTQGAGLLGAQYGADAKRFHMGKAAESGFLAAYYADRGFTGDTMIFEDRYGAIGPTVSHNYDVEAITDELGTKYELLDMLVFKPFPSIGQIHHAVTGVRNILATEGVAPEEVSHVTVKTTEHVKDHVGWEYEPKGVMSAQASMQYAIACILVDGDVSIESFTEEAIHRRDLIERAKDVDVVEDENIEDPNSFGSTVEVTTDRGETFVTTVDEPKGYPGNPMSEEELLDKFRSQARTVVSEEKAERAIDFVLEIEEQDDVTELFDYLG